MENNKQQLIEYYKENGKDKSWDELAKQFSLKTGEIARHVIRKYQKENEMGVVTHKKVWETHNGTKRESITYDYTKQNKIELQDFKEDLLEAIKAIVPEIKPHVYEPKKNPVALEISLPDIHYGKGNEQELRRLFKDSVKDLLNKASSLNIERIILPIGNDGMNSEGARYSTFKGTPQFDSIEYHQSFTGYCSLMIEVISYLSLIAPVDVICIWGNHDEERMFYAGEVISAYFTNNKNVSVNNKFLARKYYIYGNSMIMFTHGEKEQPKDLAMNMPIEQPQMFARTKFREVHCGHFHKEMVLDEFKTIKVRFIPSICTTDTWHQKMGYKAFRCGQAFIWGRNTGFEGYLQSNVGNQ